MYNREKLENPLEEKLVDRNYINSSYQALGRKKGGKSFGIED